MTAPRQTPLAVDGSGLLDVSVIIPAYNGAALIGNQLDALARQETPLAWEVIVADNGSTDATADLVRRRAATFPVELRVVDASARPGAGQARNVGARISRGTALLFCDCDDEVMPGWINSAARVLRTADLVGGANHELTNPRNPDSPVTNPTILLGRGEVKAPLSCNMAVRRETFFRVGGFDESLPPYGCEDVEFALRLHVAGGITSPAPEMRIHFRRTHGALPTLRKVYRSGIAEALVWEHHTDRFVGQVGHAAARRALVTWPARAIADALRSRRLDPREAARDLVTRIAHVRAYQTLLKGGHVPDPILLTPEDDAIRRLIDAPVSPPAAIVEDHS